MTRSIHDYLSRNRELAQRLIGCQLTGVQRLLDVPADTDLRFEWGEALLDAANGVSWLVSVDIGPGNILLFDATVPEISRHIDDQPLCLPMVSTAPDDPLGFLLREPIAYVEEIRRPQDSEEPDAFEMCGLRLTATGGAQVCVGTYLADIMRPEVAFYLPDEVASGLEYTGIIR